MKKTFLAVILAVFTATAFYFPKTDNTSISTYPPAPVNSQFLIGAMSSGDDINYTNMNDLNLNLWHRYTNLNQGWVGITNDLLYENPDNYAAAVKSRVSQNYQNGLYTYFDRPKINYLAYSRRSNYQCEVINANSDQSNLWFWAYNTHNIGNDETETDRIVRHCSDINMSGLNQGWVCKDLKSNREQCNGFWGTKKDTLYDWYVKPSIRILPSVVQNTPNKRICRIDILDWEGNVIESKDILAKNFRPIDFPNQYNGEYIEEFYYEQTAGETPSAIKIAGNLLEHEEPFDWDSDVSLIDYRVWWYDEAEMWIDYVRVDNWRADQLFKGYFENPATSSEWIKKEVQIATDAVIRGYVKNFYIEEFEYPIVPCVAYLNEKIKYWSQYYGVNNPPLTLCINVNEDILRECIPLWNNFQSISPNFVKNNIFNVTGGYGKYIITNYPLIAMETNNYPYLMSKIPNTLPACQNGGCNYNDNIGILAESMSPDEYDQWQNEFFDEFGDPSWQFTKELKDGNTTAKLTGADLTPMLSTHLWHTEPDVSPYRLREPTNEELMMMGNTAISYGAKGILWFWGGRSYGVMAHENEYARGLIEPSAYPLAPTDASYLHRDQNVYSQYNPATGIGSKFNTVAALNDLYINKWGTALMSFNMNYTNSYIFSLERITCIGETYFSDVVSYKYGTGSPACEEEAPPGGIPAGLLYDCYENRYMQVATFKRSSSDIYNNFFMIVNRRCSPVQPDYNDGRRDIRIAFDYNSAELPTYNSWKIINVADGSLVGTFNKMLYNNYIDLGWFNPGEGRLYQMVPVIPSGGELLTDEVISGVEFTCEAPVYNNGHNITIEAGTTIHFNDSSRFVMNGGTFTVGDQNTNGSQNITCDAVNGSSWLGHSFTNCEVRIYGADFSGVVNDTAYSLNLVDCPVIDIRNCTFNSEQSVKGAVNAVYFNNQLNQIENVYLYGNTFNSSGSTIPTVNISSYASLTLPLIIENNTFNFGNTAIFLSGVTGGAIKGNTIIDNYYGVNSLTSSVDIAENNITSSVNGSIGVFSAGGSEVRLSKAGNLHIGGHNNITNTGAGSNNIRVDGAVFLLDDGENVFDIASNQSGSHLYGWFPYFTAVSYSEIHNCWKVDNSATEPYVLITDGYQGSPISFTFTPYLTGCEVSTCEDYTVIDLGGGVYDTICDGAMGEGGGFSNRLPLTKGEYPKGEGVSYIISTAKQKNDSISVLMRYRNYTQARVKCLDLINTYPDSIQALSALSKLYLAVTATDTTINGAGELKTYYENLILNHPNNVSLVKHSNYFILKCKVKMRLYSQALAGFQQIINENPYSYEGLIARWDYMATSLLAPQGGAFNSEFGLEISDYDINDAEDNPKSEFRDPQSEDDKSPFTKQQRQDIRKSINTAIETGRNDDETRIKKLEEQVSLGDVNAASDLKKLRTLKEVVKTHKPANILQHVKIVSEDIRKVFGEGTSNAKTTPNNLPMVYRLSQNYPNPFNPTTKINYDLPRDAKVTIVIYDILGQEVKRLVNNELKKAGTYIVDFSAQNYASGVYFYRIEAEETNGFKFTDSKKMVLIK